MQNKIKTRIFPESNYRSVFINNKTIRQAIDPSKPITELRWPEFYDISISNKVCRTGRCKMCYAAANKSGKPFTNLVEKVNKFFGQMTDNQRPTCCAIGGDGEPLENPELWDFCDSLTNLGITPNITSNGVLINEETAQKIKIHCGCAAITMHGHLQKHWEKAIELLAKNKVKLNAHVIVSDKESVDKIWNNYNKYVRGNESIDYFVLLPYVNVGHAVNNPKKIDIQYFTKFVDAVHEDGKLAFGANFYKFLEINAKKYRVQLHPPEIFSKYMYMDEKFSTFNNSFNMNPVSFTPNEGFELGKARMDFTDNYLEE